jgi:hypothetical protein
MLKQRIGGVTGYVAVATLGLITGYGLRAVSSRMAADAEMVELRHELEVSLAETSPSGLVTNRTEAALRWAGECKSEDEKLGASIRGLHALFVRNPDEAERLLADSGLSAEAQEMATSQLIENVRRSSQRNAQNILGVMGAAVAAGAKFDTSSVESVIEQLTTGVNGTGDFKDSLFKISKLDELQEDLAKSFVVIQDDGSLHYDPKGGSR